MPRDVATFRGVPFFVDTSELDSGRKTVTFEYPNRDEAFVEDLGRKGRVIQIDGYVLGDDWQQQRDALIAALEEPGPGTIVHPYFGTKLVAIPRFTVKETREDVRIATFSIIVAETPAVAFSPSADASPLAQSDAAADDAHEASQNRFLKSYRVAFPVSGAPGIPGVGATKSLPNFTFSRITGLVTNASNALHTAMRPLARTVEEASAFKRTIDKIILDAASLVRDPISLATRFGDLFHQLITFPRVPRLGVQALLDAYSFTSPTPSGTTPSRLYELSNYDEADGFIRRGIVIEAARQVVIASPYFETYDDAVIARDSVIDAIDDAAESSPDDVHDALVKLRKVVILSVPSQRDTLPRLVSFTPPATVPALVLAHRLYGSIELADDIVARNHVRHPGFVLGGRALQVISNA